MSAPNGGSWGEAFRFCCPRFRSSAPRGSQTGCRPCLPRISLGAEVDKLLSPENENAVGLRHPWGKLTGCAMDWWESGKSAALQPPEPIERARTAGGTEAL